MPIVISIIHINQNTYYDDEKNKYPQFKNNVVKVMQIHFVNVQPNKLQLN